MTVPGDVDSGRRRLARSAIWLLLVLGCSREVERVPVRDGVPAARTTQNLVLVTLDTVRADHLGCYGYFRDTTPNLDAFAAESLRFLRCSTPIAHTTPSHLSLFTGLLPIEHGLTSNVLALRTEASEPLRTLAASLRERGLATGGFVSAAPVKRATGLDAGFETWSEPAAQEFRRPGRETLAEALAFMDRCGERPFFTWIHLYDAHAAADPRQRARAAVPARFHADAALDAWLRERGVDAGGTNGPTRTEILAAIDEYDDALHHLDEQLAPLLARLRSSPLRERTLVVITSDHGEGLGQHGVLRHGTTTFGEQFHVPLLVRAPERASKPAGTIETPLSTIDLIATLAGLAPWLSDPALLAQGSGRDVLAADAAAAPLFAMEASAAGSTALLTERWRLVRQGDGTHELFDLASDPHELVDVAASRRDATESLAAQLDAERARQQRRSAELGNHARAAAVVDPEQLKQLRALGYAVGEDGEQKDRR